MEDEKVMKRSDFLLSKVEGTISRASDINILSYYSSLILGIVTVLLAVAVVTPSLWAQTLILILSVIAAALIILLWVVTRLPKARELRLKFLRKWQVEIFTTGDSVDSLSESQFDSLIRLIDFVEDSKKAKESSYERLDNEFMRIVKGNG